MKPDSHKVLLEAGCGVGNLFFPLLEEVPNLFIYACDFSKRAVQFVKVRVFFVKTMHYDLHIARIVFRIKLTNLMLNH